MSDDRDARGLEDRVELFDRLFLCRSFHSKLSPVGGLRTASGTAGLHPSSRPNFTVLAPQRSQRHGQDDDLEACPPEKPCGHCGVSRFEPNRPSAAARAAQSKIRSSPVYAGHAIKPLVKLIISPRAPAVSDRIEARPAKPEDPGSPHPRQTKNSS